MNTVCFNKGGVSTETIALDGNAIAGDLLEVFGVDLSGATSVCATCGA